MSRTQHKYAFLWDYNISDSEFIQMLHGKLKKGRLDQAWAEVRLLEYGSYDEIKKLLGLKAIVKNWQKWRPFIRSESRIRGFDFLAEWSKDHVV